MTVNLSLGCTQKIIAAADAAGLITPQTAYCLATALWETNHTMQPVEEAYYLGSKAEAYRQKLRYYPWHGRGFAQLTWESNYLKAAKATGADLIGHPDLAMDPDIAGQILVIGSRDGWFTGKKLSDYITRTKTDYVGARRIINGTDKAAQIAAIAEQYESALSPAPDYPFIRKGSRGASVALAQNLLLALGYDIGAADGIFGSITDAAMRQFQRKRGLAADGICGPMTWAALLDEDRA